MLIDYKKLTIVIIIAVLVIATGIIFYFLLRTDRGGKADEEEHITGKIPGFPETLPQEGGVSEVAPQEEIIGVLEARLKQITDFPVLSPALTEDEKKVLFYKKDAGDLISYTIEKNEQERISRITIIGILEAVWSPQKNRAAVFYLDQDVKKGFLHIGTSSVAVLPSGIKSASWSPNGSLFAYMSAFSGGSELIASNASGGDKQILFESPLKDPVIYWTSPDTVHIQTAPSGNALITLFRYSRTSDTLSKTKIGYGLTALWSPDAERAAFSSTNSSGKDLSLSLHNSAGDLIFTTGLRTITDKCVWISPEALYCAVPRILPLSAVMPDDYYLASFHTSDRIVKIDTKKEEIREVFNEGDFDVANLLVTKNEDMIFFVDRRDGTLWSYIIE